MHSRRDETHSLQVPLRYLVPGDEKPLYVASEGGSQARLRISAAFEERLVEVVDARALACSLEKEGFTLLRQQSVVSDFYAQDRQRDVYEKEIQELLQSQTGARRVVVFDHTLRSDCATLRGQRQSREPASVVHNDYTDFSARKRLSEILPAEADELSQRRFAIVNVWRSIGGAAETSPMALCDARTVQASDLVASERRARDRVGELQLVTYRAAHRWYYYPAMRRDEALLFRTFDSALESPSRCCVHTAFNNPRAPAAAAPRESIESRSFVFF